MRNYFFDALRGVLAWLVVGVHVLWFSGDFQHSGVRGVIGCWAVDGFLVLAGFMAISTWRAESYDRYITKRFFRIIPVLAACWALATIVHSGLDTAWFIILLIQFYLVFPLIVWAVERFGRRVLVWLLLASLVCYLPPIRDWTETFADMYEFLPANLLKFVIGMILYYAIDQGVLIELSDIAKHFKVLVRLGELSYATFLVHWPLLFWVARHIIPPGAQTWLKLALITFTGVPVVLAASVFVHQYVELPGVELGRRLIRSKKSLPVLAVVS